MKVSFALASILAASATAVRADNLIVPTDNNATYSIYSIDGGGPLRTIVTKRVGISGITYSKREYQCSDQTVRFLGTDHEPAEMASAVPDLESTPIFKGSIAHYIGLEACKGVSEEIATHHAMAEGS